MLNLCRLAIAPVAVALLLSAVLPASAKVVGEPQLASTCAATAAKMLAMDLSAVSTLPTELTGGKYHVYGQANREDGSAMMIECVFDSNKKFTTIIVDGTSYKVAGSASSGSSSSSSGGAPQAATQACVKQMGGPVTIQQVSQLRPGFHEIIMKETNTGRRVACTVSDDGELSDWVEMQ